MPDAEAQCESDGGHLSLIDDEAELVQVAVLLAGHQDAFVGASDRITEGVFLGVDGRAVYPGWDVGEPGVNASRNCVKIEATGLHDEDCAFVNDFICEIDGVAVDPAAF